MPLEKGKLMNNRNAMLGFVGCIKIPACAGKTTVLSNLTTIATSERIKIASQAEKAFSQ